MTDTNSEDTAVMPPAENPAATEPEVPAAPAAQFSAATPAAKMTDAPKVMIIVAAVALGFVVLAGTFGSGVFVGAHFAGGRPGVIAGQQERIGGPGFGMDGQGQRGMDRRGQGGMMQRRGGQFRGRGGFGQGVPQNPDGSQVPTAPGAPGGRW